ncbi:MAG: dTDP-4-dehydrorhamnose 3,5-epimerase [Thermofilum sp. ex4484_82]|nr:MAG: dTDP-4-dehydrorhamnose 3,5-epimerase [Thermofilum sp. ex4484_82]OYT35983.1 MAG: dTDP-4-dehydrorhamnose 3,5-epimerase [Archaeoglobales archaeon ex4484_92]
MPFEFKKLDLPGLVLIKPKVFEDERGFFLESYKKSDFEAFGITVEFVQDNHSKSKHGVLRGLHFQKKPFEQAKLVRCIKGKIFDVVVDLRRDSPTFGKHYSIELSEENKLMLYIPRGFAHGFQVLSKEAEIIYKVDNVYNPTYESGIIWNDPTLKIDWPIKKPLLSEKDKNWPTFQELVKRCEI